MGALSVDGPKSPTVKSAEEMVGRFYGELLTQLPDWKQGLSQDPAQLEYLEREIHVAFARGADLLVAGIMAVVMQEAAFQAAAKQTRRAYQFPLTRGRNRTIRVRLLGGLIVWVMSLYCAPRRSPGPRDRENAVGMYTELAQFGCGKGISPGLQSRVARQAALCPSFQLARLELERGGIDLDVKAVRRIAYQCGSGCLALRKHEVMLWRQGQLPAGAELQGKHVTVQIDGGRTKIRGPLQDSPVRQEQTNADGLVIENAPGRSKKRHRKTYDPEWREPKLVTIFIHDGQGRMVKNSKATIDGTLLGPDAMAEIVSMHLHRLGAARASSVTFVADGATWIWDRVPTIISRAKLENVPIHQVLDCSHAVHHISLALASLGMSDQERMPLYREHRTLLRNGQWRRVVEELSGLAELNPENAKLKTEIDYLRRHGEAGRLSYPHFRGLGIPLGSGAIESSIRRVINLRLKSNGIFWGEPEAEQMLQLRALVITDRWDERIQSMRELLRRNGNLSWEWEPSPMSVKAECDSAAVE